MLDHPIVLGMSKQTCFDCVHLSFMQGTVEFDSSTLHLQCNFSLSFIVLNDIRLISFLLVKRPGGIGYILISYSSAKHSLWDNVGNQGLDCRRPEGCLKGMHSPFLSCPTSSLSWLCLQNFCQTVKY